MTLFGGVGLLPAFYNLTKSTFKRNREWFNILFTESPMGVALIDSLTGQIYEANPMFARIIGRPMEQVSHIDWMSIKHPDDDQEDIDKMALMNAGKINGFQMEKRYIHPDGSIVWINMTITKVKFKDKAHLCIIEDITARKKMEDALQESESRIRAITNAAKDAIVMMDPRGLVSYWNTAAEHILGYSVDEAMGKNLHQLIAPERYHKAHQAAFSKFHTTGQGDAIGTATELEARHKDGHEISVELSLSALYVQDGWHAVGIIRDITERKQMQEQILHMATHDALTGLPTLRLFNDRLVMALSVAHRNKTMVAVLFVDLDGFKTINDTYGHDAGDYVLKHVADSLRSSVRETDTAGRVGGDEFIIVATELRSAADAALIANKIVHVVSQPVPLNEQMIAVSASVGIALYPDDSEDIGQLIKLADTAMYEVKKDGKNGYRFTNGASSY